MEGCKGNEELGICGVRDGSTVQVVRRGCEEEEEVRARCPAEEKKKISEESGAERSEHEGEELAGGGCGG